MDYRKETFKRKFNEAARQLGVRPHQIISLKLRENVGSYSEYRELVEALQHEFGVQWTPVDGDLQGRGYLLSDKKARVLMVEHETGLEILYIAGSIASLIQLVPLILQGWRGLRGWLSARHDHNNRGVELRRLDDNGQLIEEHVHDFITPFGVPNQAIAEAVKMLESNLQSLAQRVEILEKQISNKPKKRNLKTKKFSGTENGKTKTG